MTYGNSFATKSILLDKPTSYREFKNGIFGEGKQLFGYFISTRLQKKFGLSIPKLKLQNTAYLPLSSEESMESYSKNTLLIPRTNDLMRVRINSLNGTSMVGLNKNVLDKNRISLIDIVNKCDQDLQVTVKYSGDYLISGRDDLYLAVLQFYTLENCTDQDKRKIQESWQ